MSWSWSLQGKNRECLITKYKLSSERVLGHNMDYLAPTEREGELEHHSIEDIRNAFPDHIYGSEYRPAAIDLYRKIKDMIESNLASLDRSKYDNGSSWPRWCKCIPEVSWDIEMAKRFISIPEDEIEYMWAVIDMQG